MKISCGRLISVGWVFTLLGCGGKVTVEPIAAEHFAVEDSTPMLVQAKASLTEHVYQNPYGAMEIQKGDSHLLKLVRTCNASEWICDPLGPTPPRELVLKLNDSKFMTTAVNGRNWQFKLSGKPDLLILDSFAQNQSTGNLIRVEEVFRITEDPCHQGMGEGLEVRKSVTNTGSEGETITDSCQAFF